MKVYKDFYDNTGAIRSILFMQGQQVLKVRYFNEKQEEYTKHIQWYLNRNKWGENYDIVQVFVFPSKAHIAKTFTKNEWENLSHG